MPAVAQRYILQKYQYTYIASYACKLLQKNCLATFNITECIRF